MNNAEFDFSGWATRNDLKCADGLTIRHNAFVEDDGKSVPLVWQHQHNSPENVLGHAVLENRDSGVYAYCKFNDTEPAAHAKELVRHGDICALSIYANKLKKSGSDVLHGVIREVSVVLAGANPGAFIDCPVLEHAEESEGEATIYSGMTIEFETPEIEKVEHADADATEADETQKTEELEHAESEEQKNMENKEKTIQDVFDSMTEEQKNVVYYLVGKANEDAKKTDDQKDEEETTMKHNVFDNEQENEETVLSHDALQEVFKDAKRIGSLKEAFLQHGIEDLRVEGTETYGVKGISGLYPDAHLVNNTPDFVSRDDAWVAKVMNGVHRTPFARIKSLHADLTADEARAKGYIKGKKKLDEVFTLLKRTTTPVTVYKKQKLDRDDIVDIIDFDVVAWLKVEMRKMLNEEIARAILVGDGRLTSAEDHIPETNIRPIWKDNELYTIRKAFEVSSATTSDMRAKKFIEAVIRARIEYRGSGDPSLFCSDDILTDLLLLEDTTGRRIYDSMDKLVTALRVKEIVTVPVMSNLTRQDEDDNKTHTLLGIVVNLQDYNVGADKGGAVNMFDDFDIDFNTMKYLIETRCSGALVKPYSAIAVETYPNA